jgi:imidazolonepropionase-like amidohydrolase
MRFVLPFLLLAALSSPPRATSAEAPGRVAARAIVGADVLTMDGRGLLRNQTILIRDGRIAALGPADSVVYDPREVERIDGAGRFVMPGLVDAHVHLRESTEEALVRYLRAGVTTVRDMNGRPFLLDWRRRIERGELAGPTLYVASPALGNLSSPREGYPTPRTEEEGRAAVRRFQAAGYDWIKVYSFLPTAGFAGIVEEAGRRGMPVGGHVPVAVGAGVFDSGIRSIEHLTEYAGLSLVDAEREEADRDLRTVFHAGTLDSRKLDSLIHETVRAGVWNVPTLVWFDRNLPTRRVLEAWRHPELRAQGAFNRRLILRRLHDAGARIAVGTDSDGLGEHLSPFAILAELQAMTEAGFSRREALEAATVGGAGLLGGLADFGTVTVGKRADLLVLFCDPREDLTCLADIDLVVARGRRPVYDVDLARQHEAEARR